MKKTITCGFLLLVGLLSGCMELEGSKNRLGSRRKIEGYLTKEVYEVFVESGFRIYPGDLPPWIQGEHDFLLQLVKSNLENDEMGRRFGPFTADLSYQNYDDLSISVHNHNENGWYEYAEGFLTGEGDQFTLFFPVTYQIDEESYHILKGYSGRVNEEYKIVNFQLINYMKDNPGIFGIIPTGTFRLYEEEAEGEESLLQGQREASGNDFGNVDLY